MKIIDKLRDNLSNFYMNLSIKYKIFIFYYTIIISVTLIIGIFSYNIYSHNIKNELSKVNLVDTNQIVKNIDFLQKDIIDLSTFICLDSKIQYVLNCNIKNNNSISKSNNLFNEHLQPLNNLLASKDYISFISIYGKNGFKYYLSSDNSTGIIDYNFLKDNSIYQKSKALKGKPFWFSCTESSSNFIVDNKNPKIYMCRTILDTNTYTECGFLLICVNISDIEKIYEEKIAINEGSILLLDSSNNIINYNSNSEEFTGKTILSSIIDEIYELTGSKILKIDNKKQLVTYSTTQNSKWKIVYLVPLKNVLSNTKPIMTITILLVIGCLIFSFILSLYFSSIFTSPIKSLLNSMKRLEKGNLKERVNFKYKDEIGILGTQYNGMVEHINNLINKVYKLQLQEKEAELKALQAQINPHFLYNTLDTIFWKAEMNNDNEVSEMIYALSNIFRLTLNRGEDFTLVQKEKEFIEYYLLLQKKRYKDKLLYEINFNNDILNFNIPKLILQPFVENAIVHRTEISTEKSFICIKGFIVNNNIVFTIKDNGSGINKDILNNILKSSSTDSKQPKKNGYAITNVKERLSLYYEDNYKLNIFSEKNKGTKIEIIIPIGSMRR